MQMRELVRKLIKAEDFDAVRDRLNAVDIPFYSPERVYVWQEKRYRSLMFLKGDEESVLGALSELDVYTHPAVEKTLSYSYDDIYKLMFREDAGDILEKILDPGSLFFNVKIELDRKIRSFVSKIEHAKEIMGEDFLNVRHYDTIVKDVVAEMKIFLGKSPLK